MIVVYRRWGIILTTLITFHGSENIVRILVSITVKQFPFFLQMAKTSGKIWQAKHREKLKQNEEAYQSYLEKVQLCKKLQREKDKNKPLPEKEAHKVAERLRIRSYFIKKKKREQTAFPQTFTESPFQTKQSAGRSSKMSGSL